MLPRCPPQEIAGTEAGTATGKNSLCADGTDRSGDKGRVEFEDEDIYAYVAAVMLTGPSRTVSFRRTVCQHRSPIQIDCTTATGESIPPRQSGWTDCSCGSAELDVTQRSQLIQPHFTSPHHAHP